MKLEGSISNILPAQAGECELFGDFGVFIQIILGVASILTLFCNKIYLYVYNSETRVRGPQAHLAHIHTGNFSTRIPEIALIHAFCIGCLQANAVCSISALCQPVFGCAPLAACQARRRMHMVLREHDNGHDPGHHDVLPDTSVDRQVRGQARHRRAQVRAVLHRRGQAH